MELTTMQFRAASAFALDQNAANRWRIQVVGIRADLQVTTQTTLLTTAIQADLFGGHRLALCVANVIVDTAWPYDRSRCKERRKARNALCEHDMLLS